MGIFRDYISENIDMQTMVFRYSVLTDVFGARLPEELKCKNRLSDELKRKLLRRSYSEQISRLIFLYGTGVISEEALKNLALHNDSEFLSDVIEFENAVRENEGESENDVLSYAHLEKLLLLCANSKKNKELGNIDMRSALELSSSNHIMLTNSGFIKCDRELTQILNNTGESFGFLDEENDLIHIEEPQYIAAAVSAKKYDILSDSVPIALCLERLKYYLSVYDKLYSNEFTEYAKENNIAFDENFLSEYEKYLCGVKLSFSFKAYPKKRDICGDKVNYYDYTVNSVEENRLVSSELNADNDYTAEIRLEIDEELCEKELTQKALRKYTSSRQLLENMLIEISHGNKTEMFIYKNGSFAVVDPLEFRRQLFDFNKIWGIIQLCSREKKIRKCGDVITLPQEYLNEIPTEQQIYAVNMVKEQYKLMYMRLQKNKHLQTLNDIRAQANENMKKINAEKAQKEAEKAERTAARNQGITKLNKNGGN
ncbi:MAG: hypothetical protein NC120_04935 [Ruminococcus sp.]|nr:hypothetical protein [Ruminococcus sp.]